MAELPKEGTLKEGVDAGVVPKAGVAVAADAGDGVSVMDIVFCIPVLAGAVVVETKAGCDTAALNDPMPKVNVPPAAAEARLAPNENSGAGAPLELPPGTAPKESPGCEAG
mmetsp:Transcript_16169/g.40595  ORF Transcript_16169/g.40595 Transcript_16169/m.40595 type:complete len:111 (+) Transcript_16169:732-1064(+)